MYHKGKKIFWVLLFILMVGSLMGLLVMQLWNWLIPEIFNGQKINFYQALGLLVLARLLTGFGKGVFYNGNWYKHNKNSLSQEEKDLLKRKFMEKCGWSDGKTKLNDEEDR